MENNRITIVIEFVKMSIGVLTIVIASSAIGFIVNVLRNDRISFSHPPSVGEHARHEIIYITSRTLSTTITNRYLICDTRDITQYNKEHIAFAYHYSLYDGRTYTEKPVIFYGNANNLRETIEIVSQILPQLSKPAYILNDGFEGWKNHISVEGDGNE